MQSPNVATPVPASIMAEPAPPPARVNWVQLCERFALLFAWLAVIAGFTIALPGIYLTWSNFSVLFTSQAPSALLALALIVPLTAGDYDLSVGANVTLAAMIIGVLNAQLGVALSLAIPAALLGGLALGLVNAFFIVYVRIPSLVVTLGSASVVTGLVQWMSDSSTIGGISSWLSNMVVQYRFLGVSYGFYYALLVGAIVWFVFEYTPTGRRLLFVGRGREVARLSGINVNRVRIGCLVTSALLSSFAGIVYAGLLGAADPFSGLNFLLPAFSAAYLGATSIVPGRFNPWGTLVAVYFLASGIVGLTMLGIPIWVTSLFNGAALILAVTLSQFARGREEIDLG
jgi:ribose transport system permease protein